MVLNSKGAIKEGVVGLDLILLGGSMIVLSRIDSFSELLKHDLSFVLGGRFLNDRTYRH